MGLLSSLPALAWFWWASLAAPAAGPYMHIDIPAQNSVMAQSFTLAGWAIDTSATSGPGVDAVEVWGYPNPANGSGPRYFGGATYGGARPDVGAAFGSQFTNSSWSLNVVGQPPGTYDIHVYAHSTVSGTFNQEQTVTVTVTANPWMAVDLPSIDAAVQPFAIVGWAIDAGAATGTGVSAIHIWSRRLDVPGSPDQFVGTADYGYARPDVGAIFGTRFTNSAYTRTISGLTPGSYRFTVFAFSTLTATFNQAKVIDVQVDSTAAAPVFANPSGTYTASFTSSATTSTTQAVVRYSTDGSDPTASSPTSAPEVTQSMTIKARAFRAGWAPSATTAAVYTLQPVAPTFSVPPGTYGSSFTVTLSSQTPNTTIRYTTNGTEPTEASQAGTSVQVNAGVTLRAKAFRSGWTPSSTSSVTYGFQVATPTLNIPPGAFTASFWVTITSPTLSSEVRYTTNGTDPTTSSPLLSTLQYYVNSNMTLKVKAFRTGWTPSPTVTASWRNKW